MDPLDTCIPPEETGAFDSLLSKGLLSKKTRVMNNTSQTTKSDLVGLTKERETRNEVVKSSTAEPEEKVPEDMSVVTPFLVKHITDHTMIPKDNFSRFCYRHNPEVLCNKQMDEVKMKQIQKQLEKFPSRDQEAISHVWLIFSAAPDQHRSLILQGLLSQCCFPQLSFISQEVSNLIRIDFISTLPMEISLKILCYLDCASLCNAAQVSRKWKSLADDDRVWHHMCEQHIDRKCPNCGWGLPLMHMKRAREVPVKEEDAVVVSNPATSAELTPSVEKRPAEDVVQDAKRRKLKKRPWKSVYSERFKLEKNWRKGIYKLTVFKGHTDAVNCVQFNRKYLCSASYDSTVKIWRCDTGECIRTLTGHTKGVRSLVFDSQKLITGGADSTIKVWNYHTGQCISTYRGHDDAVSSVDFSNKTIVSGSADCTVKVWHVDSRTCYTLRGHTDSINSVKIHLLSNTVFSASDDTTIRMWDLNSNQCLRIFGGIDNKGHIGQVQCVIPFIYKDSLIEDANESDSEAQPPQSATSAPEAPENTEGGEDDDINNTSLPDNPNYPTHLLTSSLDNTIKLWDVKTGKCIRTQFGHIEGVWSISADTFRIILGAHDRLIKVWDLQNGKCLHTFGNNSGISCVGLSDSSFVAGLECGLIKMYSFE